MGLYRKTNKNIIDTSSPVYKTALHLLESNQDKIATFIKKLGLDRDTYKYSNIKVSIRFISTSEISALINSNSVCSSIVLIEPSCTNKYKLTNASKYDLTFALLVILADIISSTPAYATVNKTTNKIDIAYNFRDAVLKGFIGTFPISILHDSDTLITVMNIILFICIVILIQIILIAIYGFTVDGGFDKLITLSLCFKILAETLGFILAFVSVQVLYHLIFKTVYPLPSKVVFMTKEDKYSISIVDNWLHQDN